MTKRLFAVIAVVVFSATLGMSIIGPILPLFSQDIGATGIWIGIIIGGYPLSRAVVTPFVGRLSDGRGRKLILCSGLFLTGLISLAYVPAFQFSNIGLLVGVRVLHGLAAAMIIPIAQAWIADLSPRGEEGRWMSFFSAAFTSGLGAGPLVGGYLTVTYGLAPPFIAMSALNFLGFILVAVFSREDRTPAGPGRVRPSFRLLIRRPVFKGLFIFRTSFEFAMGVVMAFLPVFAGVYLGLDALQISVLFSVNLGLATVLMPFSGRLADKLNRRLLVAVGLIAFSSLALDPGAASFWQLLGLVIFRGLGGTLALPSASALVIGEGRRHGIGQAIGVISLATAVGLAAGPVAGGMVADWVGIRWVFYLPAGVGIIGTISFVILSRRHSDPAEA